ncbi:transporter [Saccharopolyspora spinosporotrichia]
MSNYWPWWAGAVGLALVTINYTLITDRSFGVSAAWDRVLHWRAERRIERQEAQFADDRDLADALAAATAEEFGARGGEPTLPNAVQGAAQPQESGAGESRDSTSTIPRQVPLVAQAALLLSIAVGGWVAAVTSGRFELRFDMGGAFSQLVTADPTIMIGVLFVGVCSSASAPASPGAAAPVTDSAAAAACSR